jgi:hypothetical protein
MVDLHPHFPFSCRRQSHPRAQIPSLYWKRLGVSRRARPWVSNVLHELYQSLNTISLFIDYLRSANVRWFRNLNILYIPSRRVAWHFTNQMGPKIWRYLSNVYWNSLLHQHFLAGVNGGNIRNKKTTDTNLIIVIWSYILQAVLSSQKIIDKGASYDDLVPWLGQGLLLSSGKQEKVN